MLSILRVICHLCCSSLITGNVPIGWTNGVITVIPEDGGLSDPGNWPDLCFCKTVRKNQFIHYY